MRYALLAAVEDGDRASVVKLAPLIETVFPGTYILTSKLIDDMFHAGHKEALDALIAEAWKAQEVLLSGTSDRE